MQKYKDHNPKSGPHMQLAVTIALTVIYVGLALTLGGAYPKSGMPWWFFVPGTVAFCAAFVATRASAALPIPWVNGRRYGLPPRRVHLSWRAAIRLPVWAPALLVPWHVLLILRMHFDFDWVLYLAITLFLLAAALVAFNHRREIRLLRPRLLRSRQPQGSRGRLLMLVRG